MRKLTTLSLILLLCTSFMAMAEDEKATKSDEAPVQLDRPLEREVFQRNSSESAEVIISGSVPDAVTIVEARADLPGTGRRGQAVPWTEVAKTPFKSGKFKGTLKLATGGWYQLSVRFRKAADDPAVFGEAKVERVGVGDVFVTAGQSNSVNFGRPKQKSTEDLSVYFDGKQFTPAADPMPDAIGEGGTPWPLLGDMLCHRRRRHTMATPRRHAVAHDPRTRLLSLGHDQLHAHQRMGAVSRVISPCGTDRAISGTSQMVRSWWHSRCAMGAG